MKNTLFASQYLRTLPCVVELSMSESIVLSVIAAVIVLVEFKRLVCNQIPHETFHECKVTQARRSAV